MIAGHPILWMLAGFGCGFLLIEIIYGVLGP